jgi:hypothetical protein
MAQTSNTDFFLKIVPHILTFLNPAALPNLLQLTPAPG